MYFISSNTFLCDIYYWLIGLMSCRAVPFSMEWHTGIIDVARQRISFRLLHPGPMFRLTIQSNRIRLGFSYWSFSTAIRRFCFCFNNSLNHSISQHPTSSDRLSQIFFSSKYTNRAPILFSGTNSKHSVLFDDRLICISMPVSFIAFILNSVKMQLITNATGPCHRARHHRLQDSGPISFAPLGIWISRLKLFQLFRYSWSVCIVFVWYLSELGIQ